jgi:outer membrane protein, heavy metal efflux system
MGVRRIWGPALHLKTRASPPSRAAARSPFDAGVIMHRLLTPSLALVISLVEALAAAQGAPPARPPTASGSGANAVVVLGYQAFLATVGKANLELLAQRANVPIAEAQIAIGRVFPDPVLTVGVASVDVSGKGAPTATTVGLTYSVELGGKREARVAVAERGNAEARAALDDYLRTLRAVATNGFIDALYAQIVLARKQQTLASLEKLVHVNEERVRSGDIGGVQLTQSRVEAQRFRGEVLSARAEVEASSLSLSLHVSATGESGVGLSASGDLRVAPRSFDVEALLARARATRADVVARRRALDVAAARVDLARANRWVDVTLSVGWQHSFAATAPLFEAPAFDTLGATVSVPLPLSRVYRGELDAARAAEAQGRTQVQAAELRVEVEVRQALARYQGAVARLGLYTSGSGGGLLVDAEKVAETTLYNYQRGGASLLEVLEAERTVNEVYLGYYQALSDHARALVAVEEAAGVWDLAL